MNSIPESPDVLLRRCRRGGYTLAELLVLVALVAIAVAFGVEIRRLYQQRNRVLHTIDLSDDGERVIGSYSDGSVQAWDTTSGRPVAFLRPLPESQTELTACVSPNGRLVARLMIDNTASQIPVLQVAELDTGKEICRRYSISNGSAFLPDNKRLAYVHWQANDIRIVDLTDPQAADVILTPAGAPASPPASSGIYVLPGKDGRSLYAFDRNSKLTKWDLISNQQVFSVGPQSMPVGDFEFAISPDGRVLAVGGVDSSGVEHAVVIDLHDPSVIKQIDTKQQSLDSVTFADAGRSLAISGNAGLEIWDLDTLQLKQKVPLDVNAWNYYSRVATADATRLAVTDGQTISFVEGDHLRKIVDLEPSPYPVYFLPIAFVFVFILWVSMRRKRTTRVCADCGKTWRLRGWKASATVAQCPQCLLDHLSTKQLAQVIRKRRSRRFLPVAFWIVAMTSLITWGSINSAAIGVGAPSGLEIAWIAFRTLFLCTMLTISVAALLGLGLLLLRIRMLRRCQNETYCLQQARGGKV